jgi:hypothetical protein
LFSSTDTYPPFGEFPDAVLAVPVTENTEEASFGATAKDINSSGRVIGFTNSWNPPSATAQYFHPIVGFAINVDDSDYVDLTPDQAVAAWPSAINDAGLVVGTYRLHQGTWDVLHAYMIQEDGTGFVDIHPAGFASSGAVEVTSNGMVIGHAQDGSGWQAVIFPVNGHPLTELGQGYSSPSISAGCDELVVLVGWTKAGGARQHLLYRVQDATAAILSVPGVPPGYVTVGSIADDGTIVGWYDYGLEYGAFSYRLGNDEAWLINGDLRRGDTVYNQFRFCDFTSDGTIVGMVSRDGQLRAAKYVSNVRDVQDVTPGEYSAYSELYSVNETGWAVGYAGYSYGNEDGLFLGVSNRPIAVKVK